MDYQAIHDKLITYYQSAEIAGYSERHHIKPRCLGGDDMPGNIVRLPARVHFVVHLLLARIHGGRLTIAAYRMSNKRRYSSRKYEWLKLRHAEECSKLNRGRIQSLEAKRKQIENQTGERNGFYGKKHTAASRKKMSDALLGERHPHFDKKQSAETQDKKRLKLCGQKKKPGADSQYFKGCEGKKDPASRI